MLLKFCTFEEETLDADLAQFPATPSDQVVFPGDERVIWRPKAVAESTERLHDTIYKAGSQHLLRGVLPKMLILGGDHSIAMGSVSAISSLLVDAVAQDSQRSLPFTQSELIVFWVDAHADINTPKTTASGNLHGCPVSLLAGIDGPAWSHLTDFAWATDRLRGRPSFISPDRLVYIGLRDVDGPEQTIIDERRIAEFPMQRIKAMGRDLKDIINSTLQAMDPQGLHPIHISFDIDSIDPSFAPSTGTPVPDGLLPEEGVFLIDHLRETGRLVSMDLVEVNPALGSESDVQRTLQVASALIEAFSR